MDLYLLPVILTGSSQPVKKETRCLGPPDECSPPRHLSSEDFKALTKVAAEKAHNHWWSERAAEANFVLSLKGRGGSLIRLSQKKFSKAASSILMAKDSTPYIVMVIS